MHKGETYIMLYAAGICLLGSLLLAGTASGLKERQDAELELDRKMNVLKAFSAPLMDPATKKHIPREAIVRMYADHVKESVLDAKTSRVIPNLLPGAANPDDIEKRKVLPLYRWEENGQISKYAIPISGKGLWSTIYGYLALDARVSRIEGITFFKHGETPGLGGEVEKSWFQDNFRGKTLFEKGTLKHIEVSKGKAPATDPAGKVCVDGISGATLTGNGVTKFLNGDLSLYEPYFSGVRKE